MDIFKNRQGHPILLAMIKAVQDNIQYLGRIDSMIGDGDHGNNLARGFMLYAEKLGAKDTRFGTGLDQIGMILFNSIGGSMGQIYGTFFSSMAEYIRDADEIDLEIFTGMLQNALECLYEIVNARPGDKTMIDTLYPSVQALQRAQQQGESFNSALNDMISAAASGCDSTKDMVARYGRNARWGEKSRGVLDAGACSCRIILTSMAKGIQDILKEESENA